jgi:hypothetical protein
MKLDTLSIAATPQSRAVLGDWYEEQGRLDVAMLYRDQLPAREGPLRKRVEKITKSERKRLNEYARKWIAVARCTQPADREKAEAALLACYRLAGLDHPSRLVWAPSPLVTCLAGAQAALRLTSGTTGAVRDAMFGAVSGALNNAVSAAVVGEERDAMSDAVSRAVNDAVSALHNSIHDVLRDVVSDEVRDAVNDAVSRVVCDKVNRPLRILVSGTANDAVSDAVSRAVGSTTSNTMMSNTMNVEVRHLWWRYLGAQFWVGLWWWGPSSIEFALDVLRLDIGREMELRARAYFALCESCCLVWPHKEFAVLCERPHTLELEGSGETVEQMSQQQLVRVAWEGWEVVP